MTRRRAFTLLEVLISIALLMLLVVAMLAFLQDLLSSRRRVIDHNGRNMAAAMLVDRVESDLMTSLVGDRVFGAGVEGEAESLRILSRAVAVHLAERGPRDPEVFADLQRTEYAFDQASGLVEARRLPVGEPAERDEPFLPLGEPVHKVRFRYHDGAMWRDRFDSLAENRLPAAVEIALWFDPWPGHAPPADSDEGKEPLRLTFDAGGGFDEAQFARRSDMDLDEPIPDRVRVIVIPDAAADDPYAPQRQEPR